MASIFKRNGDSSWTIAWFDAQGRRCEKSSRTTDHRTAKRIAAKIDAGVALRREGVIDARQDRIAESVGRPLRAHVAAYVQHCVDAEQARVTVTEKTRHLAWLLGERDWKSLLPPRTRDAWLPRANQKHARKQSILDTVPVQGPTWTRLADMTVESLERCLALLRDQGRAARTCNVKREAVLAFAEWCVKTGRLESNPLHLVQRFDASRDQRRVRRELTDAELSRLFEVAEQRGRKLWYLLAALAGLRRSEIARLTWADVNLDAASLTVSRGKAKRTDVIPLHGDLVAELRRVRPPLALPSARVLAVEMTNETRRRDFLRAGIALVDDAGCVADLHALRTTLGTRLGRAGIAPQVAQRIMRHSDYRLTLRHYTRLSLDDSSAALARLPRIEGAPSVSERAQATGTDGWDAKDRCPQKSPQSMLETTPDAAPSFDDVRDGASATRERKLLRDATLRDEEGDLALAHPAGFEPTTLGSEDRYSIR